ncbi:MAG: energy-coupling factor ABC transporter permease [Burkholderiales bacterium]|nr:energy-coupling factor ABC transporter permease [Burkholderiales bacterium]
MNFPDDLFPPIWTWFGFSAIAAVWLWCLRSAPWRRLQDAERFNVWLGAIVAACVLWSIQASVRSGLNLHLLGATAFTLMFGRQLAILGISAVAALVAANGAAGWDAYPLTVLASAAVPCFLSHALRRAIERRLPANLFVYIFGAAFFGAAVCLLAAGTLAAALLWCAGIYPARVLWAEYLIPLALLAFAEAWLNGALVTLMAVYYPHWLESFEERRYLSAGR